MSNINVPHIDYPFRFGITGHAVEVEQDSIQDIESCIVTALLCNKGDRIELPDFGTTPFIFDRQPIPLDQLYSDIVDQEPRALLLLSQAPSVTDYLTAIINATLQNQQPTIGGT